MARWQMRVHHGEAGSTLTAGLRARDLPPTILVLSWVYSLLGASFSFGFLAHAACITPQGLGYTPPWNFFNPLRTACFTAMQALATSRLFGLLARHCRNFSDATTATGTGQRFSLVEKVAFWYAFISFFAYPIVAVIVYGATGNVAVVYLVFSCQYFAETALSGVVCIVSSRMIARVASFASTSSEPPSQDPSTIPCLCIRLLWGWLAPIAGPGLGPMLRRLALICTGPVLLGALHFGLNISQTTNSDPLPAPVWEISYGLQVIYHMTTLSAMLFSWRSPLYKNSMCICQSIWPLKIASSPFP